MTDQCERVVVEDDGRLKTETNNECDLLKCPYPTTIEDLLNEIMKQNQDILLQLQECHQDFTGIEKQISSIENSLQKSLKKKIRRKANQIDKAFKCTNCSKTYGSLISLNLHVKMKHKKKTQ